jgi:hypothetical protein
VSYKYGDFTTFSSLFVLSRIQRDSQTEIIHSFKSDFTSFFKRMSILHPIFRNESTQKPIYHA